MCQYFFKCGDLPYRKIANWVCIHLIVSLISVGVICFCLFQVCSRICMTAPAPLMQLLLACLPCEHLVLLRREFLPVRRKLHLYASILITTMRQSCDAPPFLRCVARSVKGLHPQDHNPQHAYFLLNLSSTNFAGSLQNRAKGNRFCSHHSLLV